MNKNFRVITINGIRGMLMAIFLVLGLIAGFIISPGWLCMTLWNNYAAETLSLANMNLIQGIMLWAIIALSLYALNNRHMLIGFGSYQGLTPEQMSDVMNRAKASEDRIKSDIERITRELKEKAAMKVEENITETSTVNKENSQEEVENSTK